MSVGEGPDTKPTARGQPAAVGRVVVLSGPSAVGKSTVVRCLRERIPNLHFSVSATTRAAAATGVPVLIEVDLAGARAIKKTMPEAVTVFLAPPSWQDLQARLIGRGTETADVIQRRLDTARIELAAQGDFDKVVVNRRLESACAELVSLLVGTAPGSP